MSTQVAVVTGASSGLGFECAKEFAKRGQSVVLVARRSSLLAKRVKEIGDLYSEVTVLSLTGDVGSASDVFRIHSFLKENSLSLKWLVNNAGTGRFGNLGDYTTSDIEEVMRANLVGTILMSQQFAEDLISNQGVLCNVMSTAALNYRPKETVYTAAKWGARGFTEALRAELKGQSIRVMAVYPGGMNTPFWDQSNGYITDATKFMDPAVVAERIVANILDAQGCQVSDITINRP